MDQVTSDSGVMQLCTTITTTSPNPNIYVTITQSWTKIKFARARYTHTVPQQNLNIWRYRHPKKKNGPSVTFIVPYWTAPDYATKPNELRSAFISKTRVFFPNLAPVKKYKSRVVALEMQLNSSNRIERSDASTNCANSFLINDIHLFSPFYFFLVWKKNQGERKKSWNSGPFKW